MIVSRPPIQRLIDVGPVLFSENESATERERVIEREDDCRFEDLNTLPCRERVVDELLEVSIVRGFNSE